MLPDKQLKILMKLLGIKKEKTAVFFLARLEGWVKKNGNNKITLMKGLNEILKQIHEKEIKQAEKQKEINLNSIKNKLIKKYAKEIIELNIKLGWGDYKISKYLLEKHNAKISRSSLYRFLKQQNNKEIK